MIRSQIERCHALLRQPRYRWIYSGRRRTCPGGTARILDSDAQIAVVFKSQIHLTGLPGANGLLEYTSAPPESARCAVATLSLRLYRGGFPDGLLGVWTVACKTNKIANAEIQLRI